MIKEELLNDGTLVKHYSDKNVMLLQKETGAQYAEPIDINPCPYTYEETDVEIEKHEPLEETEEPSADAETE